MSALRRLLRKVVPEPLRQRLRAWETRRMIRNYPRRVVEHTYGGWPLKVSLEDPLAAGWYDRDWPVQPEIVMLKAGRLRPGARVFDAGAHQGVVALMLAREVGPEGQVLAIEANPHNAAVAQRNRELNAAANLEVLEAALANKPGTLTFSPDLNGQLSPVGTHTVPAVTLDELAARYGQPDVVFLDIEGAEVLALQGGQRVLEAGADFFIECHVGCGLESLGGSVPLLLNFFSTMRYELLVRAPREDAEFRPMVENDPLFMSRFYFMARLRA